MTMTSDIRSDIVAAVESYVQALGTGDYSRVPFAPDVKFEGPLGGYEGADVVVEVLSGLVPVVTGVDILDHVVEGNVCGTRFDLHTVSGTAHVFDRFEVRDGQLLSIRPYYDPTPLLAALATIDQGGEPAVSSIHHLALTVSDADRSAAWYRALFDLEEVLRGDDDNVSFRVLVGGKVFLGVRQYHRVVADRFDELRTGLDHFALEVSSRQELERWEDRLRERGIPFSPVAETPIGSVIVLRDPDNIQVELWLPAAG